MVDEQGLVDVLQITYNIFDMQVETQIALPLAEQTGVGLLCRMPLARGVLTGKFHLGQDVPLGHRALLDGDECGTTCARRIHSAQLHRISRGNDADCASFQFDPTAISAIIPGARTIEQLEENAAASNGVGLPADIRERDYGYSELRGHKKDRPVRTVFSFI